MRESPPPTDNIDYSKPGIWPWIIGGAAFIALVSSVNSSVKRIETDLRKSSEPIVNAFVSENAKDTIAVSVDGRDVILNGTVSSNSSRTQLVQSLNSLVASRVVRDQLDEIKPEEQNRISERRFEQLLKRIDMHTVRFEPNSAELTEDAIPALRELANLLRSEPQRQIKITGHTDNSGNAASNLKISQQRAEAVAQTLLKQGVQQNQFIVQGYGHTQPRYSNDTEAGRAKNRRIELVFMK